MTELDVPSRDEIDERWTWDHSRVFSDLTAWEDMVRSLPAEIESFSELHAEAGSSAEKLLAALDAKFELLNAVERIHLYAGMFHNVDTTDQEAARRSSQARSLSSRAAAALAFLEPLIISIGTTTIEAWLDLHPPLGKYAHYLDNLFRKEQHILSPENEKILGLLHDPFSGPYSFASMLTDADFRFEPAEDSAGGTVTITQGNFVTLMANADRALRENTWNNYFDKYYEFRNTLTSSLEASIKQNAFLAKVRGFESTLEAALFESNLPTETFYTLIETIQKHLPIWHRYFALRRSILGVQQLHPFDLWAPLAAEQPVVLYEQAVAWICGGLAPMGEDYVETVRQGSFDQRWVDVYPNRGKRKGAFSWGVHGTPPYIVMNYGDTFISLSTLAHELGHSMHSLLAWEAQPPVYGDYSIFVAEVASNFHQALVRAHLLETVSDPKIQLAVLEEAMSNFLRYFFIMPTLARFELEMHERIERGEGLNADLMIDSMLGYLDEAFGGEVEFKRERAGMLWAIFGHLYADYYVFQYATGIAGAHAAARRILSNEEGALEGYLSFLRAGDSKYPLEALADGGIDLTTAETIEQAFLTMDGWISKLEGLAQ